MDRAADTGKQAVADPNAALVTDVADLKVAQPGLDDRAQTCLEGIDAETERVQRQNRIGGDLPRLRQPATAAAIEPAHRPTPKLQLSRLRENMRPAAVPPDGYEWGMLAQDQRCLGAVAGNLIVEPALKRKRASKPTVPSRYTWRLKDEGFCSNGVVAPTPSIGSNDAQDAQGTPTGPRKIVFASLAGRAGIATFRAPPFTSALPPRQLCHPPLKHRCQTVPVCILVL